MTNKLFIVFYLFTVLSSAQTIIGVDTLIKNGPIDKRINLVIMGDGYTAAQMTQFITNATTSANYLLNTPPFSNYKKYFNVFAVKIASPQSGITHMGVATDISEPASPTLAVTNNFNTRFDNYNVHRNIYAMNPTVVYAVLAATFPSYDQVIILGNSTEYGGAGGAYAVSSINAASSEIVAHEMGHSFAGLADEYWAGASFAVEKPNMTSGNFTTSVKWAPWLGISAVGIYPYDTFSPANQWFKPHKNCKMQVLNAPFCSVCKQTIIEKIHKLTNLIDDFFPDTSYVYTPTTNGEWFKTFLIKPSPYTLKRTWELNSNIIERNKDSIALQVNLLQEGDNTLMVTVTDTTLLSKDNNHSGLHTYSVVWKLSFSTVGIEKIKPTLEFSVFPNPASDVLNLKYHLHETSETRISIIDLNGTLLKEEKVSRLPAGEHERTIDLSGLQEGSYILALTINNQVINNKFIITK